MKAIKKRKKTLFKNYRNKKIKMLIVGLKSKFKI